MDLFKQLVVLGSIALTLPVKAQISSGKKEEKPVVEEKKSEEPRRVPDLGLNDFCFYLGAGRVYANRTLESNKSPFGAPLGTRADETGLKTWSFQAGVRNRVNTYFSYDVGFALDRSGESYDFDDPESDSAFSYTSRYSYFAMPVQGLFTYGKDFRFFAGGGLQPQLIAGYRQEQEWKTTLGSSQKETVKDMEGFNQFGIGVLATCGVQWRWTKTTSIYVVPTWMWALTSTFDDQADYIHKARTFNLKFGVVFHLKQ